MSEHQSEQPQMTPNLKPHVRPKTVGTGKNAPPQITVICLFIWGVVPARKCV